MGCVSVKVIELLVLPKELIFLQAQVEPDGQFSENSAFVKIFSQIFGTSGVIGYCYAL